MCSFTLCSCVLQQLLTTWSLPPTTSLPDFFFCPPLSAPFFSCLFSFCSLLSSSVVSFLLRLSLLCSSPPLLLIPCSSGCRTHTTPALSPPISGSGLASVPILDGLCLCLCAPYCTGCLLLQESSTMWLDGWLLPS